MKAICAWCAKDLGARPGPTENVTHGICPACVSAQLAKVGIRVKRDADGVARPMPSALNEWLHSTGTQEVGS